jgi:hypothetical protein
LLDGEIMKNRELFNKINNVTNFISDKPQGTEIELNTRDENKGKEIVKYLNNLNNNFSLLLKKLQVKKLIK